MWGSIFKSKIVSIRSKKGIFVNHIKLRLQCEVPTVVLVADLEVRAAMAYIETVPRRLVFSSTSGSGEIPSSEP